MNMGRKLRIAIDCRIGDSLVPCMTESLLAREMWDLLAAQNFQAWSLDACFRDPGTGRVTTTRWAVRSRKQRVVNYDGVFVCLLDEYYANAGG